MADLDIKRMTVKLGTNVVSAADGEARWDVLYKLVRDIALVKSKGIDVLLVSSGAIGLGRKVLAQKKEGLAFRQACAAVGQNLLMNTYQEIFKKFGLVVAQILVTADDLSDRKRYLNLREMLAELLSLNIVPVINENDSVSTMEIQSLGKDKVFGDNDKLSALVASKLGSDLLVLLTNVDGIYSANPNEKKDAKRVSLIRSLSEFQQMDFQGKSSGGRGGMAAKIDAIRLASLSGLYTIVANGGQENVILQASQLSDPEVASFPCTVICPTHEMRGRTHWIGFSSGIDGVLVINQGAQQALEEKKASLLPIGIIEIQGKFAKGDVVSIQNQEGMEIGRGLAEYSSLEAQQLLGCHSSKVKEIFGAQAPTEIVHRNKMAVFQERQDKLVE